MQISRLAISQQPAQIKLDIKKADLQIKQPSADLDIKQPRGELKIKQRQVKVKIDSYPARFDLGIKNSRDFAYEIADRGKQAYQEMVSRYVSNGDRMMAIENKKDVINQIFQEAAFPPPTYLSLKYKRGPSFDIAPNKLEIKYQPNKPEIKAAKNKPEIRYTKGEVKVGIKRYQNLDIEVKGQRINRTV